MPSRTSQVRFGSSSTSKMRTLCAAWCQPSGGKYGESASSPVCPNGEWPTSWPSAIASASGSLRHSAAASERAICVTCSVCVRRVTKWSPSGLRKTWVLCFSRRNALEWMIRSRSRSNAVRNSSGSSGRSRPRLLDRAGGGRAEALLLGLAGEAVAAQQSSGGAHLLHGPMMPLGTPPRACSVADNDGRGRSRRQADQRRRRRLQHLEALVRPGGGLEVGDPVRRRRAGRGLAPIGLDDRCRRLPQPLAGPHPAGALAGGAGLDRLQRRRLALGRVSRHESARPRPGGPDPQAIDGYPADFDLRM